MKKILLYCMLSLLIATPFMMAPPAWSSALSDLAGSMPSGTWAKLNASGFTHNYLKYPGGTGNLTTQYMGEGTWDPTTRQILFLAAGHFDNSQLHVYAEHSNAWSRGVEPPGAPVGLGHGYSHNAISVTDRRLGFIKATPSTITFYQYNIDQPGWSVTSSTGNDGGPAHGLVYFPERAKWYVADGTFGHLREYDPALNSWRIHASNRDCFGGPNEPKTGYYHSFASYNPVRQEIVFGGGNTSTGGSSRSTSWCTMDTGGTVSVRPLAPHTLRLPDEGNPQHGSLVTTDPVSGDLLVLTQIGQFYAFNFSTNEWSVIQDSATRPVALQKTDRNVTSGFVVPISTHGVVLYGDYEGSNTAVYLYKHAQGNGAPVPPPPPPPAADTTPPAAPRNLTASSAAPPPSEPPPSSPPAPAGTFAELCALSTTIFCQDFAQLPAESAEATEGIFNNTIKCKDAPNDPTLACPELDAGALKFTVPSNSGAGGSGQYYIRFSDHNGGQSIGPGQEVFIRWKQRFSASFLNTNYSGGGGWKHGMVGAADEYSCASNEVVVQNTSQRGFPQMYHACGYYEPFSTKVGPYDFDLQPGGPGDICSYTDSRNGIISPACTKYYADEWLTYQVGITHGTSGQPSRIRLWAAREGQASTLVIDYSRVLRNTKGFGKMWLLPYHTGKDKAQVHPTGYIWYDQLIISRVKLPD